MYLAAFQIFKLPPCLPSLLSAYQYDRTLAGGFMSVYAVVGMALSVFLGRSVDRHGVTPMILWSLGLMIVANILGLAAPESGVVMLGSRGLEGIAFAGLAIAGPVLATRSARPQWMPMIISLTAIWIPVGQLVATFTASFFLTWYGWRSLWFLGIIATCMLGVWMLILRKNGTLDRSVQQSPTATHQAHTTLSPMERRRLVIAAGIFTIFATQYFAYMTWLPQYLVEVMGLTLYQSLAGYALPVIMVVIVSLITGGLLRAGIRVGSLLITGLVILTIVWWLVPVTGGGTRGIASLIIYGIGAGLTPTCLFAMPSTITGPRGATASAFGIIMTGRNVGGLIGPILLAQIFSITGVWTWIAPVFAVNTTLGLGIGVWLAHNLSETHKPA